MKLLILTCLVAVALARPKFPLRQLELFQNQVDSNEEILKERKLHRLVESTPELREDYVNELNRQRELLREKQSDEIKVTRDEFTQEHVMANAEQRECSSSSSSEEVVPNITEQKHIPREAMLNQYNLEQLLRQIKHNQPQLDMVQAQKYFPREREAYQTNLEQFRRMNVHNQILERQPIRVANEELAQFYVEPLQQFYQLSAYPSAAWYYPPQMQYAPLLPFFHIFRPTASENAEKTVMPVWW